MFSDTVQDGGGWPFTGKSKGPGVGVRRLLAEGPRGSAWPGQSGLRVESSGPSGTEASRQSSGGT